MAKFPAHLAAFPGLRQKRWDLDMVRVAQDWALEHGYEPAEAWLKETTPPERDTGEPQLDPAVVRAAMEAGVEPMSMGTAPRRLIEILGLDYDTARAVHSVIRGSLHPDDLIERFSSVRRWVNQCYNRPSWPELKMAALNEIVHGFGVEGLQVDPDGDMIAEYINAGDTYNETIVRLTDVNDLAFHELQETRAISMNGRYIIASYGDVVEAWERAHLEDEELEDEE